MPVLRKIDCVLVRVPDLTAATAWYTGLFGLRELWRDEVSVGLAMPDTDAEIVLHTTDVPAERSVHYLVDDVEAAVSECLANGCALREPPFDIAIGRCAVLTDPYGNALSVLDVSRGRRT